MFCAMGLTKKNTGGVPVSLSQCNGLPGAITIDDVQERFRLHVLEGQCTHWIAFSLLVGFGMFWDNLGYLG
jgi:hypothetical protein